MRTIRLRAVQVSKWIFLRLLEFSGTYVIAVCANQAVRTTEEVPDGIYARH